MLCLFAMGLDATKSHRVPVTGRELSLDIPLHRTHYPKVGLLSDNDISTSEYTFSSIKTLRMAGDSRRASIGPYPKQGTHHSGMNDSTPITAPASTSSAGLILYRIKISKTPTEMAAVSAPVIAPLAMVKQPASRSPIETGASPC
jgi:hypothetical protein